VPRPGRFRCAREPHTVAAGARAPQFRSGTAGRSCPSSRAPARANASRSADFTVSRVPAKFLRYRSFGPSATSPPAIGYEKPDSDRRWWGILSVLGSISSYVSVSKSIFAWTECCIRVFGDWESRLCAGIEVNSFLHLVISVQSFVFDFLPRCALQKPICLCGWGFFRCPFCWYLFFAFREVLSPDTVVKLLLFEQVPKQPLAEM
jgi:hypothetical protein